MSDHRYHNPDQPPAPPLDGLLGPVEARMSFASADRRERTDPGVSDARPNWLDPTPAPEARRRLTELEQGSLAPPVNERDDAVRDAPMWPWVVGGLLLGTLASVAAILWVNALIFPDEEGLVAAPLPVAEQPADGVGQLTR